LATRCGLLFVIVSLLGAGPAPAQDYPAWYVRGALGATEMHGSGGLTEADLDQTWLEGRVGRALGERGMVAVDAGVAHSSGKIAFTTVTAGLELRAFPRSLVSPWARLEGGYLNEEIGSCLVGGWGIGLAVRAYRRLSLRGGLTANAHCSDTGPLGASVGLEFRW